MNKSVIIDRAKTDWLAEIARIHFQSLPEDFLPLLGRDFLERVYYPSALCSNEAITFVALIDERLVGFVTVAHESDRFTRAILRGRWPVLAKYALRASFRRPRFLWDSAGVLRSAIFAKKDPIQGEIVFIAVDQEHRGQGLGKTLVKAALDYLGKKQVLFCRTKTLENNRGVIQMYEGMGWSVRDRFRLIGRGYVTLVSPRIIG